MIPNSPAAETLDDKVRYPGGTIALGTVLAVYRGGGDRNACRNLAIAALPGLTVALEIL